MKDTKELILTETDNGLVKHGEELRDAMVAAVDAVSDKYMKLCRFIRDNKIAPVRVRELLLPVGFPKTRVSEINRISQVSDELWKEMEAKAVGRKGALLIARHAGMESEDFIDVTSEVSEDKAPESSGPEFLPKDPKEVAEAKKLTMAKCAKTILSASEFLNLKTRVWKDVDSGYVLTLSKVKVKSEKPTPEVGK